MGKTLFLYYVVATALTGSVEHQEGRRVSSGQWTTRLNLWWVCAKTCRLLVSCSCLVCACFATSTSVRRKYVSAYDNLYTASGNRNVAAPTYSEVVVVMTLSTCRVTGDSYRTTPPSAHRQYQQPAHSTAASRDVGYKLSHSADADADRKDYCDCESEYTSPYVYVVQ